MKVWLPGRLVIALFIFSLAGIVAVWWWHQWREHSQDAVILAAARRYGLEPALVKAVVWRESWFNPRARGRAGEIGLMQIRAAAAQDWANAEHMAFLHLEHLIDPATNTVVGTWYLQRLLKRYSQANDPLPYALAAYNAGPGNVLRWNKGRATTNSAAFLEQIDFPGTRRYVETVLRRYARYRALDKTRAASKLSSNPVKIPSLGPWRDRSETSSKTTHTYAQERQNGAGLGAGAEADEALPPDHLGAAHPGGAHIAGSGWPGRRHRRIGFLCPV